MFAYQDRRGSVEVAFTDRHGGVSAGPYASLNLAARGEADVEEVAENLDIVGYALARGSAPGPGQNPFELPAGVRPPLVVALRQVHGAEVHVLDKSWSGAGAHPHQPLVGDGLVTDQRGVVLMVRVADCVPVLLADPAAGVVGAAHAGRQGMVARVVPRTVAAMRSLGARQIEAWIGPHVCGACYEVPADMREEVAREVPQSWAETSWGTPSVDVGAGVRAQLAEDDVAVAEVGRCTLEDEDLFSYRRQGAQSGRMAGLVWVRP